MFSDRNWILKCCLVQVSQTRGTPFRFVRSERPSYFKYKMRPTTQPSISSAGEGVATGCTLLQAAHCYRLHIARTLCSGSSIKIIISLSSKKRQISFKISNCLMLLHSFVSCLREGFILLRRWIWRHRKAVEEMVKILL